MKPRYGELFAGIGGMSLGLERAGWLPTWFAENEPYPSSVLAERWPSVPNLGDVKLIEWKDVERVDLVVGGYPCPFASQAARGRNTAENLWPYMRDAIAVLRPRYVLIENVAAHLGRGWSLVLADLDALGFDAEWATLTACAFGAPHTRRRLFALAYPHGSREPALTIDGEMARLCPPTSVSRDGWLPTTDDARADDGVPYRLERDRALGNAVVPQVAQWIGEQLLAALPDNTEGRE